VELSGNRGQQTQEASQQRKAGGAAVAVVEQQAGLSREVVAGKQGRGSARGMVGRDDAF